VMDQACLWHLQKGSHTTPSTDGIIAVQDMMQQIDYTDIWNLILISSTENC